MNNNIDDLGLRLANVLSMDEVIKMLAEEQYDIEYKGIFRMKKIFNWVLIILQVLFLFTAYGIQMFSMKKMGMMRYVIYINQQWEAKYPIETLRTISIVLLVLLSIIIIILYALIKKDNQIGRKKALPMLLVEVIVTLAFVFFALFFSPENYRSYYFTSLALAIVALIQDIKMIVYLKTSRCS
ncbi:hypothetical protein [Anaerosolibacter sp.]|uniref:hypothetical protein n=1 Tax=Anaerosolibacter sp. TaxID=1872527 RepID=UPI0039F0316D